MTQKQLQLFNSLYDNGIRFNPPVDLQKREDIVFRYGNSTWRIFQDNTIICLDFSFDENKLSIENEVPPFLLEREGRYSEGYGVKRVYLFKIDEDEYSHSDIWDYLIFDIQDRIDEEALLKSSKLSKWGNHVG